LEHSVSRFVDTLARQAKKQKQPFTPVAKAHLVSKSRRGKHQVVNFGWTGDREAVAGHGWGVSWHCAGCGRVMVAHLIGRGRERPEKMQRLAGEILASLECHGSGGWQTWSVFGLRVEIPEEFELARSKLMAGRLELSWKRARKPGMRFMLARDETIGLTRVSLADVLLQNETLAQWATRTLWRADKQWIFMRFEDTKIGGHDAVQSEGDLRDMRLRLRSALFDFVRRRRAPRAEMRVWHSAADNKIYALTSDLLPANAHVATEVLDSLEAPA